MVAEDYQLSLSRSNFPEEIFEKYNYAPWEVTVLLSGQRRLAVAGQIFILDVFQVNGT